MASTFVSVVRIFYTKNGLGESSSTTQELRRCAVVVTGSVSGFNPNENGGSGGAGADPATNGRLRTLGVRRRTLSIPARLLHLILRTEKMGGRTFRC